MKDEKNGQWERTQIHLFMCSTSCQQCIGGWRWREIGEGRGVHGGSGGVEGDTQEQLWALFPSPFFYLFTDVESFPHFWQTTVLCHLLIKHDCCSIHLWSEEGSKGGREGGREGGRRKWRGRKVEAER